MYDRVGSVQRRRGGNAFDAAVTERYSQRAIVECSECDVGLAFNAVDLTSMLFHFIIPILFHYIMVCSRESHVAKA